MESCDLGGGANELIGSTRVTNTGEVPIEVEVTFRWQLGNGSWVDAKDESLTVDIDSEELVFFSKKVDIDTASSFQDHPEYFDGTNCETDVTIMGAA